MRAFLRPSLFAAFVTAGSLLASCGGGGGNDGGMPSVTAQFTPLGVPLGMAGALPVALSADASVAAVTATDAQGREHAFRWTQATGFAALGTLPGGSRSSAAALSADGSVIVGSSDASDPSMTGTAAFRWTAAGGMQRIPPLPLASICAATGVSGDGKVVAGTCLAAGNTAFRWTQESGPVALARTGTGTGQASSAAAISRDGVVVAGAGHPLLTGAMLWPAGGESVVIGKLQADHVFASATAISRDGGVVTGLSVDAQNVASIFRWTAAGGLQRIGDAPLGVGGNVPAAMSGDGAAIVGWAITSGGESALLWEAGRGLRPLAQALAERGLQLPGWTLRRAAAISDDGRVIAGTGIDPQGAAAMWLVRLD